MRLVYSQFDQSNSVIVDLFRCAVDKRRFSNANLVGNTLQLDQMPDVVPIYGGTFDEPNWFDRSSEVARHIFFEFAQRGTLVPVNVEVFMGRAAPQRP